MSRLPRSHPGARRAAVALLAAPLLLAGCSGGNATGSTTGSTTDTGPGGASAASLPAVPVPAAGVVSAAGGTWAALPMGHLQEPDNTFWQLLHSPDGRSHWTDQVAATAVATNGGVVVAAAGSEVAAGVVPSQALTFSPVITTTDSGARWATGLLPAGLAPSAFSLALGPGGSAVALTGTGPAATVRTSSGRASSGPLDSWSTLTTAAALAGTGPGRSCGLTTIDTVAYTPGGPAVGGTCRNPGVVGRFVHSPSGGWVADAPPLGPALENDRAEVISDRVSEHGSTVVVAVADPRGTSLVPAWQGAAGSWSTGPALPLADPATLDSVVTAPDGRLWVLQGATGAQQLDYSAGPGSAWARYATPPAGTATVSPGPDGTVSALAVDNADLTVWTADSPASPWGRGQVLTVPIEYGSSN